MFALCARTDDAERQRGAFRPKARHLPEGRGFVLGFVAHSRRLSPAVRVNRAALRLMIVAVFTLRTADSAAAGRTPHRPLRSYSDDPAAKPTENDITNRQETQDSHTMRSPVVLFLLVMSEGLASSNTPRRSVPFKDMSLKQFTEPGFGSLSSLMIRDDIGQLVVGAAGKVLTLSLEDITEKTGEANWTVSLADKTLCQMKGKDTKECDNFIRTLHTAGDGKMLVCGTNAFNPACDFMTFTNGKLSLEGKKQVGRGKVPFDPYQRFASLMDGNTLYSATSSNFLGTELVFQRHGLNPLKTEMKHSWFNEPTIISISLVEASKNSEDGEDDNVFLFFTENAVEERHDNIQVSRIARVCKSDLGGKRTLQRKWTSFLKARLDCPLGDAGSPSLVQDVFLLQDQNNWRDSVFYATFTYSAFRESSGACSRSAVCAYKLSDVSQVFSGRFLTERDTGRWDTHTGEEPFPHPGSCINDELRAKGVTTSLDLSDKTLLFVKNHPLMEGVVTPMAGKPLLVRTGTRFSKIVVDRVTALDGRQREVMLIGTDSGWLQKAVRFDGEDGRVIEELQLFQTQQPVNFLQLYPKTGQLYSGTSNVAVQVNVSDCSRYTSCDDCLLARDPYCGWDKIRGQCGSVVGASLGSMIQNLTDGDIRMCPELEEKPAIIHLTIGTAQFLPCAPETNLPISWRFSDSILPPGPRHSVLSQGLVIRPSYSDAGLYTCETVETVNSKEHRKTVVQYLVQVQDTNAVVRNLRAAVIALSAVTGCLTFLIRRHLKAKKQNRTGGGGGGNENSNNNQAAVARLFCHHDQTADPRMEEGLVHTGANSGSVADTEEGPGVKAGSVISILILPEGTVAKAAEEEVETGNDNRYTVIETTE